MKYPLSPLTGLLTVFALIVGAWAQGYAQARPRAEALLSVVICAGNGAQTVLLDSRGLPVRPEDCAQGLCPDCLPVPPLAVHAERAVPAYSGRSSPATALAPTPVNPVLHHSAQLPRGPPAAS